MDDLKRPDRATETLAYSAQAISQMGAEAAGQFWDRARSISSLLMDVNADAMTFIGKRIARNNEMLGRVAQCRSLPEFLDVESQWFRAELDDYSEYGRKVAELNNRLVAVVPRAPEAAEPAPSQAAVPGKPRQISQPALQAG